MQLPNLLNEPLTLPARIEPLPNQLTLPEPTMATKTADKPAKTPRKKVTVKPAPAVDVDRDGMLREACGSEQWQRMWGEFRSNPTGVTSTEILDLLTDIWGSGWGQSTDTGTWFAKGGAKPGIWFGIPSPIGPASLSGEKLAQAVRKVMEIPEPGASTASPETDDELLLRALEAGHDRWRLARENAELPDGELYQLLKITWKKPVAFDRKPSTFTRAFYARSNPYPAIWFDVPAAVGEPALGAAALLAEVRRVLDLPGQATPEPLAAVEALQFAQLPLAQIVVVENDRETFADEALQELADSIKAVGILQPLTVSLPDAQGLHTLIAGERRLRAAKLAGLETVPVVMRAFSPEDLAVARLTENLLRVDLTPIEQAKAFRRLLDGGLTQRDLAAKIGWSQALIANRVRLLNLPEAVQRRVISGEINPTDARQLATWADRANVMQWLVEDLEDNTGTLFQVKPLEMLWDSIEGCSQAMSGSRGPRFKVTDELREQLDIVEVHIGNRQESRAFNVTLWNEQQQAAQAALRERKAAAAEKKQAASDQPAAAVPRKPTLTTYTINQFWQGWVGRQLVVQFGGKLKPKQTELLRRIALVGCGDARETLLAHWKISFEGATAQLLTRSTDTLLDAIAADFLQDLQHQRGYVLGDAEDALAIAEACGITLDAFRPDAEALQAIPVKLLQAWVVEYDVTPAQGDDALADQLVEVWTPGWIPEELDYTGEQA
jgi:ParB family chromosome partitioning protein